MDREKLEGLIPVFRIIAFGTVVAVLFSGFLWGWSFFHNGGVTAAISSRQNTKERLSDDVIPKIWNGVAKGASRVPGCSPELLYYLKIFETDTFMCTGPSDPECNGAAGEFGFFQIYPSTKDWTVEKYPYLGLYDLYDLEESAVFACHYLKLIGIEDIREESQGSLTEKLLYWNRTESAMKDIAKKALELAK